MKPVFTDHPACRSRAHCETCRDEGEAGRKWRRTALPVISTLPPDGPDFACPHDLPWGFEDTPESLVAPIVTGHFRGRLPRKPWEYRVTVAIPHLNTPELLPLVIDLLRLQTERPYLLILDTGSPWAVLEQLEKLRAPDVEVHHIRAHGTPHSSDLVCHAMDLALSLCRTEFLFATHSDAFARRRDLLADFAARCDARTPVVAWRMSDRSWMPTARGKFEHCPGHVCAMHHVPTLDRLGVTWGIRRYVTQFGDPAERSTSVWPDTESTLGSILAEAAAAGTINPPLFVGEEINGRQVNDDFDHSRSTTGTKLRNIEGYATRIEWLAEAKREAAERIEQWRKEAVPPVPPNPWMEKGPKLWATFHARPLKLTTPEAELNWLHAFAVELVSGGCGCLGHWLAMTKKHPPDLSSPAAYARWQHARHNDVSRRLGKPELDYAEAARLHGWDKLPEAPDHSPDRAIDG